MASSKFPLDLPPSPNACFSITGLTSTEAFHKVDSEITRLEAQLLHLRGLRNTIPSIATLPNEVLTEIFMHCHNENIEGMMEHYNNLETVTPDSCSTCFTWDLDCEECHARRYEKRPQETLRGYVRMALSWVSRRWRSLALSHFPLWAFVTNSSLAHIQQCIERSSSHPLSVYLHLPGPDTLRICLQQLHRISRLHVRPRSTAWVNVKLWTQPAPHLTSLYLEGFDFRTIEGPIYPGHLFGGDHPQIRTITLADCNVDCACFLISAPTLTSLNLVRPRSQTRASMVPELRLMPALTGLRHLKLLSCIYGTELLPTEVRVTLPNLLTLTIAERCSRRDRLFSVLHRLDLPIASVCIMVCEASFTHHKGMILQALESFKEYWLQALWSRHGTHSTTIKETGHDLSFTISGRSKLEGSYPNRDNIRQLRLCFERYTYGEETIDPIIWAALNDLQTFSAALNRLQTFSAAQPITTAGDASSRTSSQRVQELSRKSNTAERDGAQYIPCEGEEQLRVDTEEAKQWSEYEDVEISRRRTREGVRKKGKAAKASGKVANTKQNERKRGGKQWGRRRRMERNSKEFYMSDSCQTH
ncbi:hypothetical protein BDN72DRAFT_390606 [Pluteus cervinus]|uniref:Uncharacterized protein n=1 Tax=Pluteus cervinus TaxID=181527 RepID=A0ACD3A9R1_9AGAR|nr:hypothetical protein BDN72DRAFT_390606 [Pluteus cervinus]